MKLKEGYMINEILGDWVVVPLGEQVVELNAIITLNESGANLWKKLEEGCSEDDLINTLRCMYDLDEPTAKADVAEFVEKMKEMGFLQEE